MVVAYIRVSTLKQALENQKHEIYKYVQQNGLVIDRWIEETESGVKNQKTKEVFEIMKENDTLIISELSRIGRKYWEVLDFVKRCVEKKIKVYAIKENMMFEDDLLTKVCSFAYSLVAEIERNLISSRTKEALARRKAEGMILGRPIGTDHKLQILQNNIEDVYEMKKKGIKGSNIAFHYKVSRSTLFNFYQKNKSYAQ